MKRISYIFLSILFFISLNLFSQESTPSQPDESLTESTTATSPESQAVQTPITTEQAQTQITTEQVQTQITTEQPVPKVIEVKEEPKPSEDVYIIINGIQYPPKGYAYITTPNTKIDFALDIISVSQKEGEAPTANEPHKRSSASVQITKSINWDTQNGSWINPDNDKITFFTPKIPGTYPITVSYKENKQFKVDYGDSSPQEKNEETTRQAEINLIVQYPFDRYVGSIEGYPIGFYPDEDEKNAPPVVANHKDKYQPPGWFIKVTKENSGLYISKHFKLGAFATSWDNSDFTFIALSKNLVNKLEMIIKKLNDSGTTVSNLHILKGFESPVTFEKKRKAGYTISKYSRHQYGDSVAFIIDENNDGVMDDLNGDGNVDITDLEKVKSIITLIESQQGEYGGLGLIMSDKEFNTPYIQIDTRGFGSRWVL